MNGVHLQTKTLLLFLCEVLLLSFPDTANAQAQTVGPSIREVFEASKSFSGGAAQVIKLENQKSILATSPGTTINFFGGDCITLLDGRVAAITSSRTIEVKVKEFYFELLNDSLGIFELEADGNFKLSIVHGPGAVVSFSADESRDPASAKTTLQIKEGQRFSIRNNTLDISDKSTSLKSIRYSDKMIETFTDPSSQWQRDELILAIMNCAFTDKQSRARLRHIRLLPTYNANFVRTSKR